VISGEVSGMAIVGRPHGGHGHDHDHVTAGERPRLLPDEAPAAG
jgi:hypothetical protein